MQIEKKPDNSSSLDEEIEDILSPEKSDNINRILENEMNKEFS